jgi:hypothetical protein
VDAFNNRASGPGSDISTASGPISDTVTASTSSSIEGDKEDSLTNSSTDEAGGGDTGSEGEDSSEADEDSRSASGEDGSDGDEDSRLASDSEHESTSSQSTSDYGGSDSSEHATAEHQGDTTDVIDYDNITPMQKKLFWQHRSRWNIETFQELFAPLRSAVNLNRVFADAAWQKHVKILYTVACVSLWRDMIRPEREGAKGDMVAVYTNIRSAPDHKYLNRPPIERVPTRASLIDRHPRPRRAVQLDDIEV